MGQTSLQHDATHATLPDLETAELRTSIRQSLAGLSDESLSVIAADGDPFASIRWYRLLERLDLPAITSGDVDLKFAVVSAAGAPVAVCPVLRARGASLFEIYSLRRYYFEIWIEHVRSTRPEWAARNEWFLALVGGYRRFLQLTGCSLDDYLLVFSPLTYKTQVSMAAMSPDRRTEVLSHLLAALKLHARQEGRPLWFLSVDDENSALSESLEAAQFQRVFFTHNTRIDLSRFDSFHQYLQAFSSNTRKTIRREMRQNAAAGIRFRWVDDISRYAAEFSRLGLNTSLQYPASYLRIAPDFWTKMSEELPASAGAIVAEHEGRLVGFSLIITSQDGQLMRGYRLGRQYDCGLDSVPFYFGLAFYEPIRWGIEHGFRELWLGPGNYPAKTGRGAEPTPLYSYFWFPLRRDRRLLQSYLRECGEVARQEQRKECRHPHR